MLPENAKGRGAVILTSVGNILGLGNTNCKSSEDRKVNVVLT